MSNEEYHSKPSVSKSGLDAIARSPLHYWNRYVNPNAPEFIQTDSMVIGSVLHNMVLEPEKFDEEFAVRLEPSKGDLTTQPTMKEALKKLELKTSGTKQELIDRLLETEYADKIFDIKMEKFKEDTKDKIIIKKDSHDECKKILSAIQQHDGAMKYLATGGKSEVSLFWTWELGDNKRIACRCRPDFITEDGYIVDLKSALSAAPRAFSNKARYDFRYHVQAAFYTEGYRQCYGEYPKGFKFIAAEKTSPYPVSVFNTSRSWYEEGMKIALNNLHTLWECRDKDQWPSYNNNKEIELEI